MYKLKRNLANFIIFFFIILFSLSLFFGVSKLPFYPNWSIKIIFFSTLSIIFLIFIFFLKKEVKNNVTLLIMSSYIVLFFVNFYLETKIPNTKTNVAELAEEAGVDFDNRIKIEVIRDLRKKDIDAYPSSYAGLLQSDIPKKTLLENNLYPLGGISNVTTVMCNESGSYSIYLSDKFGFNNDKNYYQENIQIMLIGDSFVHGHCVKPGEDIAGYLRSKGFNALSFGIASNGPLSELATLREYGKYLKPKIILWFYHPNDVHDLHRELKTPILKDYLKEDFSQNLIDKQIKIDIFLKKIIEKQKGLHDIRKERKRNKEQAYLSNMRNYLTLHHLRFFLDISSASTNYDRFEQIMFLTKKETDSINAELYFIYLPDIRELHIAKNNRKLDRILSKLDIATLNFTEVLKETENPRIYFPWTRFLHFNKDGYALLGDTIIQRILK